MEGSKSVGSPGNRVGFTRACAVLNQIALTSTISFHIVKQLADNIQLVVTRENQRFLLGDLLAAIGHELLIFGDLQMNKLLENVHHTFFLENLFPQIFRGIAVGVSWVALSTVTACTGRALVERQKEGVLTSEFGCHPDFGVVNAEVAQDALIELEADFSGITVIHPLPLGIVHVLTGVLVLQLKGEHRDAI